MKLIAEITNNYHYSTERETRLKCDASKSGLGACLEQKLKDGSWVPISFASRQLNAQEVKYSTSELELLAVVWSMYHFRYYLYGNRFELITDHKALLSALRNNRANKTYQSRLVRWVDKLLPFDFTVTHLAGSEMGITDYLSRNASGPAEPESSYDEKFVVASISNFFKACDNIRPNCGKAECKNRGKLICLEANSIEVQNNAGKADVISDITVNCRKKHARKFKPIRFENTILKARSIVNKYKKRHLYQTCPRSSRNVSNLISDSKMSNFNSNRTPVNRPSHPVYQNVSNQLQPPPRQTFNPQFNFNPNNVNSYPFNSPFNQNSQVADPNTILPGFIQNQQYFYIQEESQPQNVYLTPYPHNTNQEASDSDSSSERAPSPPIVTKEVRDAATSPIQSPEQNRGRTLTKGRGRGAESTVPGNHNCSCEIFKIDD